MFAQVLPIKYLQGVAVRAERGDHEAFGLYKGDFGAFEWVEDFQESYEAVDAAREMLARGEVEFVLLNGMLDAKDAAILSATEAAHAALQRQGPMVGDWVQFADGHRARIAYVWPDGFQPEHSMGSYAIGKDGHASFSGSLRSWLPRDAIEPTGEKRHARFWFFHHGIAGGHRGVDCELLVNVWRCKLPMPS